MRRSTLVLIGCTALLTGCSFFSGADEGEPPAGDLASPTSSATLGTTTVNMLQGGPSTLLPRPSAALGLYVTAYLAQGIFLPVRSAMLGVEAQQHLFEGQGEPITDETFVLLQEFGNVLQIDVSDELNRSPHRRETLDAYVQSLRNVFVLAERKFEELEASIETLREDEREKRKTVQELERAIRDALNNEDYTGAGSRQRSLTDAQGELAQVATKREQTEDIADRYEKLLDIARERIVAIEANRLILIAGLKVIQLPGIEDLNILLEKGRRRRGDGGDIIGAGGLR